MNAPIHKDYTGAKFGMWLFLFTEVILFSGLFVLYAIALRNYGPEFASASKELSLGFGTVNTLILLTSSLWVAMSVTAIQRGEKRQTLILLAMSILAGGIFLVNKFFEWSAKFHHGIYLNGPELLSRPKGEVAFFNLYYVTTGLHGLHVIIGGALLAVVFAKVKSGKIHQGDFVFLENSGLYWHLVDLIWIFVFPLYYLIL